MSKNTYAVLILVVSASILALTSAANTFSATGEAQQETMPSREKPFTPAQGDFIKRIGAARQVFEYSFTLVEEFMAELVSKKDSSSTDDTIIGRLKSDPLLILTWAKYFTTTELETLVDFVNSTEIHTIVKKISQKIAVQDVQFRRDLKRSMHEFQTILRRAEKQLGKTTKDLESIAGPKQLPAVTDKGEILNKLVATRQLLDSSLPLINEITRRQLNLEFKNLDGSRISSAVKNIGDSIKENPLLIIILQRHFEAKELNKIADFLGTEAVRNALDKVSRQIFVEPNGPFQQDMEQMRKEMEIPLDSLREILKRQLPEFFEEPTQAQESGKVESSTEGIKKAAGKEDAKAGKPAIVEESKGKELLPVAPVESVPKAESMPKKEEKSAVEPAGAKSSVTEPAKPEQSK